MFGEDKTLTDLDNNKSQKKHNFLGFYIFK